MSLSTHPPHPPSPLPPSLPPHPHPPPRASTLFNDGVTIIYSYLDTRSWNSVAQTSRHWFQIAVKSGRCECRIVHRLKIPHERSSDFSIQQSLIDEADTSEKGKSIGTSASATTWSIVTQFFYRTFSNSPAAQSTSSVSGSGTSSATSEWSLHAHYQTHFTCSLNAISRLVSIMPSRTPLLDMEIEMGLKSKQHDDTIFQTAVDAKSIILPVALKSISIIGLYPGQYTMPNLVPFISTAIHPTKSSLTSLTLRVSPLVSLAPICLHPSLQVTLRQLHLSFEPIACKQSTIAEILQMISRMILLTHLTTSALAPSMDTLSLMPTMTDLQQWQVDVSYDPLLLSQLARIAPQLRFLPESPQRMKLSMNLSEYSGFTQLRSIHFFERPKLNGGLSQEKSEQEAQIVNALSVLALPLESLHFDRWALYEVSSWRVLSHSLPRLRSLNFRGLGRDPILPLMQLAHQIIQEDLPSSSCLTYRLESLTADWCSRMEDSTFFSSPLETTALFPQLRSLQFNHPAFSASTITPEFIETQFNTSLFLPQLRRFRFVFSPSPPVYLDYDQEREGEQRCRIDKKEVEIGRKLN